MYQGNVDICPGCGRALQPGEQVAVCPVCRTPQHIDCWNRRGGCAVPGCSAGRIPPAPPAQHREEPAPRCACCGGPLAPGERVCTHCGASQGVTPPAAASSGEKKRGGGLAAAVLAVLLLAIVAVAAILLLRPKEVTAIELEEESLSLMAGTSAVLKYEILPENAKDQTVTWTSDNEKVATVKGGEILAVSLGTCRITVTTANGLHDTCKVTVWEQEVEALTLSQTKLELKTGETAELSCSLRPEGVESEIFWSSSDETVAQVHSGRITALGLGTCTVTARAEGGVKAECMVTVLAAEEEQTVLGSWTLIRVEDRYNETGKAAEGITIRLEQDQTGVILRGKEETAIRWNYDQTDSEGDYWYDLILPDEEMVQIYYSVAEDRLCLYDVDEIQIFQRKK